jgi:hypothetical protein
MNSRLLAAIAIVSFTIPGTASSQITAWVNVVQVGGQSNLMFIVVSEAVGEPGCSSTRIVLPPGILDADNQKRLWAAASTAVTTGQRMQFALSGCHGNFPTMIASDYWWLQNN